MSVVRADSRSRRLQADWPKKQVRAGEVRRAVTIVPIKPLRCGLARLLPVPHNRVHFPIDAASPTFKTGRRNKRAGIRNR